MPLGSPQATMFGASNLLGSSSAMEFIEKVSFTGAANPTTATLTSAGYAAWKVFINVLMTEDSTQNFGFQVSIDDGSSWDNSSEYSGSSFSKDQATNETLRADAANTRLWFVDNTWPIGSAAGEHVAVDLTIFNPSSTVNWKSFQWVTTYSQDTAETIATYGYGMRKTTTALNKFRLEFTGGSAPTATGYYVIYGLKDSA